MNTRKSSALLIPVAALLFSVAAVASEFPIDGRGASVRNESASANPTSDADCPPVSSTGVPTSKYTGDLNAHSERVDTSTTPVADEAAGNAKERSTRSGGSSGSLVAPKIRSNRWQSLVPGAIQ